MLAEEIKENKIEKVVIDEIKAPLKEEIKTLKNKIAAQKRQMTELQVANEYLLSESNLSPVVAKVLAQKNQFRCSVGPNPEIVQE